MLKIIGAVVLGLLAAGGVLLALVAFWGSAMSDGVDAANEASGLGWAAVVFAAAMVAGLIALLVWA